VDDSGFSRTPDRLLKFCGTHVWLLEVFKTITSICGSYYLGGSATSAMVGRSSHAAMAGQSSSALSSHAAMAGRSSHASSLRRCHREWASNSSSSSSFVQEWRGCGRGQCHVRRHREWAGLLLVAAGARGGPVVVLILVRGAKALKLQRPMGRVPWGAARVLEPSQPCGLGEAHQQLGDLRRATSEVPAERGDHGPVRRGGEDGEAGPRV
jgi:hypothetical protein